MSLEIEGLRATVAGNEILRGVDLVVGRGEVHALMGPNGSGKSTLSNVIMGRPGYEVTGGSIHVDGQSIMEMDTWERAHLGLFVGMQYPVEVEGVSVETMVRAAATAAGRDVAAVAGALSAEAELLGVPSDYRVRGVNVDMSGGEKKRNETMQLAVLGPKYAILDELDSGLDVDGLRIVAHSVEKATNQDNLGVLVITHYNRLLEHLLPDVVHVFTDGVIVQTGGAELAVELEETGYDRWMKPVESAVSLGGLGRSTSGDAGEDPFADPLAGL